MQDTDRSFVIRSWVTAMRRQYPFSEMSHDAIAKYSKRVEALIDIASILIACDPNNEDVIYGFICYEKGTYLGRDAPTVHFVWVRKKFRQLGIGTQLICSAFAPQTELIYTHHSKDIKNGNLKKKWRLVEFDPYYVEGALYTQARKFDAKAIYHSELTNPLGTTT